MALKKFKYVMLWATWLYLYDLKKKWKTPMEECYFWYSCRLQLAQKSFDINPRIEIVIIFLVDLLCKANWNLLSLLYTLNVAFDGQTFVIHITKKLQHHCILYNVQKQLVKVFCKIKVFLKISQILQESTCGKESTSKGGVFRWNLRNF